MNPVQIGFQNIETGVFHRGHHAVRTNNNQVIDMRQRNGLIAQLVFGISDYGLKNIADEGFVLRSRGWNGLNTRRFVYGPANNIRCGFNILYFKDILFVFIAGKVDHFVTGGS